LAIVLAVTAINLVVDPYGIYRIFEVDGFNGIKARAAQRGYLVKAHALERFWPHAIILGNSRAEVGFDPEHPGFSRAGGSTLNLALPGTDLDVSLQFLRHAISKRPPRIVVAGLDFVDARITGDPERALQDDQKLAGQSSAPLLDWRRRVADYIQTLASLDALYDSVATIRANRQAYSPALTRLGFNPMRDYLGIARAHGYHMLFLQRDMENAKSYLYGPKEVFVHGTRNAPYFRMVRELVDACRAADVELHLVIYPYHAHILELFHLTGLMEPFEQWKLLLVEILREEGDAHAPAKPYPLWDFSGYNEFTVEHVPRHDEREAQTRWYWEAGHFKKELGNLILDRILAYPGDPQLRNDLFGTDLIRANVEPHLARVRAAGAVYRTSHPDEVAQLAQLVHTTAAARAR
jgi:hypothetical protein